MKYQMIKLIILTIYIYEYFNNNIYIYFITTDKLVTVNYNLNLVLKTLIFYTVFIKN